MRDVFSLVFIYKILTFYNIMMPQLKQEGINRLVTSNYILTIICFFFINLPNETFFIKLCSVESPN